MTKTPNLIDLTGQYSAQSIINNNYTKIKESFENTLSRDGSTPNQMEADIDLNGNNLLNVYNIVTTTITVDGIDLTESVSLAASNASAAQASALSASSSATSAASSAEAAQLIEDQIPDWKGSWTTSTLYETGDLVRESGSSYICLEEHTSGTFSTDLSNGKWELFASAGAAGAGTGDMLASNNLSDVSSAATSLANIGGQPVDAALTSISGLTTSADKMIYTTASDTYATTDLTSAGRALLDDASASDQRTTLGLSNLATVNILDDDTFATATADRPPSAESTKAYVDNNISSFSVGVNQTWQNVMSSRSPGVAYQNTTGKPIMCSITVVATSTNTVEISSNGSTWVTIARTTSDRSHPDTNQFIVPDQHYYRIIGGATLYVWAELR